MTKVIELQDQIQRKKKKDLLEKHRGRLESVQKIIQCTSCRFRCAMCGMQVDGQGIANFPLGLTFCESCRLEFEEYREITKGRKEPDVFWHNAEWLNVWSSWFNYRKAVASFMNSREFKLLIEELNSDS
jgi:hypothetical protein